MTAAITSTMTRTVPHESQTDRCKHLTLPS